jgi:hypothetical protein
VVGGVAEEHGGAEHEGEGQCPEHEDLFAGGSDKKSRCLTDRRRCWHVDKLKSR